MLNSFNDNKNQNYSTDLEHNYVPIYRYIPHIEVLKKSWRLDYAYFEIQVFGELNLADVEVFEFHGNPPEGNFCPNCNLMEFKFVTAEIFQALFGSLIKD